MGCIHARTNIDIVLMKVNFGHGIQISFIFKISWQPGMVVQSCNPSPNLRGRSWGVDARLSLAEQGGGA